MKLPIVQCQDLSPTLYSLCEEAAERRDLEHLSWLAGETQDCSVPSSLVCLSVVIEDSP